MRYLVFDSQGQWGSNGVVLTEIEVYSNDQKVNYDIGAQYNSVEKGNNLSWDRTTPAASGFGSWGKHNLKNGDKKYSTNEQGSFSSAWLMSGTPNDNEWCRFVIDLKEDYNNFNIIVTTGSPEKRLPKTLRIYCTNNFSDDKHLKQRSLEELTLLKEIKYIGNELTVFEEKIDKLIHYKHLLYKDGEYGYIEGKGGTEDLIPKMTSNIEEYGIAFASSEHTVNLTSAYKAFNKTNERDVQDNWFSAYQEGNSGKSYIGYDFKRKVNVSKLKLVTPNRSDTSGVMATIDGFDFEGWTGSEWEKIQNFYYPSSSVNVALYEKELEVNNEKEYSKYRLNNLKSINQRNNTYGVAIGEIVMYGGGIKFVSLGTSLPTDEQFEQYGVEDLTEWLPFINEIQGEKKIITKASKPLQSLNVDYLPETQFIKQNDFIKINKETLGALSINEGQTKGNIRVAAQFPDVDTFSYVFKDNTWSKIAVTDATVFSENGNTIDEMNLADWSTSPLNQQVRFIYTMKMNDIKDSVILSSIDIKLKGVVSSTPVIKKAISLIKAYTFNGYLENIERLNTINFEKLEFKSDSLINAQQNQMHNLVIDVFNSDSVQSISSSNTSYEDMNVINNTQLGESFLYEFPIDDEDILGVES